VEHNIPTRTYGSAKFSWRLALADFIAWAAAVPLAVFLRFDFALPMELVERAFLSGVIAGVIYVVLAAIGRLYSGRYVTGTFDEVLGIGVLAGVVAVIGSLILFGSQSLLPRSTFIVGGVLAGSAMLAVRFLLRRSRSLRALNRDGNRTLIYGAGDAGSQLATLMQSDRSARFVPVGFIDDDPNKRYLRRANLRVLGTGADLTDILVEESVETLVIAVAGVTSQRLQEIDRAASAVGVRVQVIPTTSELVGGSLRLGDVSDLSEEELMGRRPIHTDEAQIREFLRGKRILVTGAGGSIGSELVRQIYRYSPGRVALLDRDESALHEAQLTIDGTGLLTSEDLILCDLRDAQQVERVVTQVQPDIIFHAAALKHLAFLERFPSEAWKTNVIGTQNLIKAARDAHVSCFVNISTDKAADPTSILGHSKRITEGLVVAQAPASASWVSVRFGNVLGSRGSVITTFRYQISKGGPVTVTHPDVSRYFMTIREAVHLVLQAAVLGANGETLILDMGEPVRIADIAHFMIDRSGRDIPITFSGLRPGEKLDEVLIGEQEIRRAPKHPLISHVRVDGVTLQTNALPLTEEEARELFRQIQVG
jgi:FlaA1/EpsC-like NDP-sugar epimerase